MKIFTRLEPLESRIAPASVTFTDVDGDLVKITSSVDLPGMTMITVGDGQLLQELVCTDPSFQGASITITVTKKPGGDGLVDVGYINATGRDLKSVSIKGDLGQIDAGDADLTTPGLGKLMLRTMGTMGTAAQPLVGSSMASRISGDIGSVVITGDFQDAYLSTDSSIGSISIGGSMIGGSAANSGRILADANIGNVKIGGSIVGGIGVDSAHLYAGGTLGSVTVGGSVIGGDGSFSARLRSGSDMGAVKITGSLTGGDGSESGEIFSRGNIASVSIGGSLVGGDGSRSGRIWTFVENGNMGPVKIGGDLKGGDGDESGSIVSRGILQSLTVGGNYLGGNGDHNLAAGEEGQVFATNGIGTVSIKRNISGGTGGYSAHMGAGANITSITVGGSVKGNFGAYSAAFYASGNIDSLKISGSLEGGYTFRSGSLEIIGFIKSVTIGGSVQGGSGDDSGRLAAGGGFGTIKIARDLVGGGGAESGRIIATNNNSDQEAGIGSLTIGGSVLGGTNNFAGSINIKSAVGSLKISGDLRGGDTVVGSATGSIQIGGTLTSLVIGGSVIGSSGVQSGHINLSSNVGTVRIGGDVLGNDGSTSGAISLGTFASKAAESIFIGGSIVGGSSDFSGFVESTLGYTKGATIGGNIIAGNGQSLASNGQFYSGAMPVFKLGGSVIGPADGSDPEAIYFLGNVGKVQVKGDLKDVTLFSSNHNAHFGNFAHIGSIAIGGSILGADIHVLGTLGTLTVKGRIEGSAANPVFINTNTTSSPPNEVAVMGLASMKVGGSVHYMTIRAGFYYDAPYNGSTQVGSVTVGGDWMASGIIAGLDAGPDDEYFTGDEFAVSNTTSGILSRIASVVIAGRAVGTNGASDQFGFNAQEIGFIKISGNVFTRIPNAIDAIVLLDELNIDTRIVEVA